MSYDKAVSPGDSFIIAVRAVDDFGNVSLPVTFSWSYPPSEVYIVQEAENEWSGYWGYYDSSANTNTDPENASFQSFTAVDDFHFNKALVKVRCYDKNKVECGPMDLRLSVYGSGSDGSPDFTSLLGDSLLSGTGNLGDGQELAFSFADPVLVSANNVYWLVLDIAGPNWNTNGLREYRWQNAIQTGGSVYSGGKAGSGYSRGLNNSCGGEIQCSFDGNYKTPAGDPRDSSDWYFKLGFEQ